jgi:ABC-type amino acid transport system permease subunit
MVVSFPRSSILYLTRHLHQLVYSLLFSIPDEVFNKLMLSTSDPQSTVGPQTSNVRIKNRLGFLYTAPWWLLFLIVLGIDIAFLIASTEIYANIFDKLREGIAMTLGVSVISYMCAITIGLTVGLIRSNPPVPPKPGSGLSGALKASAKTIIYNLATLYVSVMRGLPILIVLLIVAFVVVPAVRDYLEVVLGVELAFRGSSPESAIIALALTYGAFLSETFRAGIQSIGRGQVEAARSLGMTYLQTIRYIVLPQAVRRILPPLGNDLVSMIKDSSLVQILGVRDISQIAKTTSGANFRYLETYSIVAMIYLTMTVIGSLFTRYLERITKLDH